MRQAPRLDLARKHRPQFFQDIVGQQPIAMTLANAIESRQVAPAYLFFGPRGVGKTTTARILAKALNCAKGLVPKPCGACASCKEITAGSSIDALELDAASHTQVDKVREMILETVGLAPSRDRYKVFIIDEVHMLSMSSFSALLKTLEEPPQHVVFILATTELTKVPATVISRCQRFRFRPLSRQILEAHLERLAQSETIQIEPKALELIARTSGGSLRDALSLLDQASAYGAGSVTAQGVAELLGILPEDVVFGVARAILDRDASSLGSWLARISTEGFDPAQLLRDLRERFQELYRFRLGLGAPPQVPWDQFAQSRSPDSFSFILRRIQRMLEELRRSETPWLAFELGMFGMLEAAYDLGQWVKRLEDLERKLTQASPTPSSPAQDGVPEPQELAASLGAEQLWLKVIEELAQSQPALAGCLEGSRLLAQQAGNWTLIFRQIFKMEQAKSKQKILEQALSTALGRPIRLRFEAPETLEPVSQPEAGLGEPPQEEGEDASSSDASQDAHVKKVLGVLGGRVKQVRKIK